MSKKKVSKTMRRDRKGNDNNKKGIQVDSEDK